MSREPATAAAGVRFQVFVLVPSCVVGVIGCVAAASLKSPRHDVDVDVDIAVWG